MKILLWPFNNQRAANTGDNAVPVAPISVATVPAAASSVPTEVPPTAPPEGPRETPAEIPAPTPVEIPQPDAPPLPVTEPPQATARYIRFKRREHTWIIRRHTLAAVPQPASRTFPISNNDFFPNTNPHQS